MVDKDFELIKNDESIEINKLWEELNKQKQEIECISKLKEEITKQNEIISIQNKEIEELKKKINNL